MKLSGWRAVVVATFLLAGCSSSGTDPSPKTTVGASLSTTTTTDTNGDSAVVEPAAEQATTTGPPAEVEALPLGDPEEDSPVPRVARPAARRSAGTVAPRQAAMANPVNRIDIPKIGLSHRTFEGLDMPTINRGPSHWPGTALPGERGNTVFPGHRTTYTRPFWDIDKLVAGDEVTFTSASGRFVYRVTETFVVNANEVWIKDPTEDATFTIFACHPKGSAKQRYVVKGTLTAPPADPSPPPTTSPTEPPPPPPSSTTTTTRPPAEQPPPLIPGLP